MRLLTFILCLSHLTTADDVSPLAFNDELRDQIQKFQPTLSTKGVVRQRHLITTLARYARIHKHFVQLPKGRHGYRYRFPEPAPDFDQDVAMYCSSVPENLDVMTNCLEYMAEHVMPKTNWAVKPIDLLENKLYEHITDSAFSEVLTFVSIMCWATTNRLSFLDDIPCTDKFYTKNITAGGKYRWDGILNSIASKNGPMHGETWQHDDDPFHCAILSFCPSPCTMSKRDGCVFERHLNVDLAGMIDNRWNLTYPCPNNQDQIYRPDLDICVHRDDCLYKTCPANSVCEEGLPTSECICALGYAPDPSGACLEIDLTSLHIPWKSPYATDASAGMRWTIGASLMLILR